MCLASRRKVHFNIEMDLDVILSESTPAARRQMRRLGKFAYTEHSVIKCASVIFAASRHRKLSVVEPPKPHSEPPESAERW